MFGIRADMNEVIGMGHIMRCLSIADAIKSQGKEVLFIIADKKGEKLLTERGYSYICLSVDWKCPDLELDILKNVIKNNNMESLLVDKYEISENYLADLCEITEGTYLDDMARMIYPCHNLIMYANYYSKFSCLKEYKNTKLLLGTNYVPLRREFSKCGKKIIKGQGKKVLFLSGGTDTYKVAESFVTELEKQGMLENLELCMICGIYSSSLEILKKYENKYEGVSVCTQVKDMWNYMKWADICISAGGTALYELSACGTPFISYLIADNQKDNVLYFQKDCDVLYAGDMRFEKKEKIRKLVKELMAMLDSQEKRRYISEKIQKYVDGKGAERIAEELIGT